MAIAYQNWSKHGYIKSNFVRVQNTIVFLNIVQWTSYNIIKNYKNYSKINEIYNKI